MTQFYFDGGFSYTKAFASFKPNNIIVFPSVAGEIMASESIFGNQDDLSISIDGVGSYAFGETAQLQSSIASRRQDHEWIFSDQYLAALLLSISEAFSPNTREMSVDVVTGLPDSDFQKGPAFRAEFKNALRGTYRVQRNGYSQTITINSVLTTSQGWGPIFYHLLNEDGSVKPKPDVPEDHIMIGSINIGGNTVEAKTLRIGYNSGSISIKSARGELSSNKGVFTLLPHLRAELDKQRVRNIQDDHDALNVLVAGGVRVQSEWVKIDLSRVKRFYAQAIEALCTTIWPEQELNKVHTLILTGGGAHIVREHLGHFHSNIVVSDQPQLDTVRGYQRLWKLIERKKG